jgi:hypothetical protein
MQSFGEKPGFPDEFLAFKQNFGFDWRKRYAHAIVKPFEPVERPAALIPARQIVFIDLLDEILFNCKSTLLVENERRSEMQPPSRGALCGGLDGIDTDRASAKCWDHRSY